MEIKKILQNQKKNSFFSDFSKTKQGVQKTSFRCLVSSSRKKLVLGHQFNFSFNFLPILTIIDDSTKKSLWKKGLRTAMYFFFDFLVHFWYHWWLYEEKFGTILIWCPCVQRSISKNIEFCLKWTWTSFFFDFLVHFWHHWWLYEEKFCTFFFVHLCQNSVLSTQSPRLRSAFGLAPLGIILPKKILIVWWPNLK